MLTIGLDVHRRLSVPCVPDSYSKSLGTKKIRSEWDKLLLELSMSKEPFRSAAVTSPDQNNKRHHR